MSGDRASSSCTERSGPVQLSHGQGLSRRHRVVHRPAYLAAHRTTSRVEHRPANKRGTSAHLPATSIVISIFRFAIGRTNHFPQELSPEKSQEENRVPNRYFLFVQPCKYWLARVKVP
jgi:hypothetical protein